MPLVFKCSYTGYGVINIVERAHEEMLFLHPEATLFHEFITVIISPWKIDFLPVRAILFFFPLRLSDFQRTHDAGIRLHMPCTALLPGNPTNMLFLFLCSFVYISKNPRARMLLSVIYFMQDTLKDPAYIAYHIDIMELCQDYFNGDISFEGKAYMNDIKILITTSSWTSPGSALYTEKLP